MRGKQSVLYHKPNDWRITPAHAGKTFSVLSEIAGEEDHPRACGENLNGFFKCHFHIGSPPRMRGKRSPIFYCDTETGITPAHAGKTWKECGCRPAQ